jgi:Cell wall-associated hydrolases (invasion-associated proteins)
MTKEKHILLCLAFSCCTGLGFGQSDTVSVLRAVPPDGSHTECVDSVKNIVQNLILLAESYLDSPYKLGARGPKTFDCSGFVSFLFEQFDVQLPRTCKGQMRQGTQVDKTELRAGDLVFFQGRYTASVGHVGLVVDNSETQGLKFIHASRRGVKEDILEDSEYYRTRYITGVRLL